MRRHLAAVDAVDLAQLLLHEGVPGLPQDGLSAPLADDLPRVPHQPRLVQDRGPGMSLQEGARQQADNVVPLDEPSLLVEKEAAIVVAVPRHAEVGPGLDHLLGRHRPALLQHRVGNAVGEVAVRLKVDLDELQRQLRRQFPHHRARAAVAGIGHDLQRLQVRRVGEAQQVLHEGVADVLLLDAARLHAGAFGKTARAQSLDLLEARISTDRHGALAYELHPVVVGRVMACRDHGAGVAPVFGGRPVDRFGPAEPDVQNGSPFLPDARDGRGRNRRRGEPDVTPDHHGLRVQEADQAAPHLAGQVRAQVLGNSPPDVIRLEAGEVVSHRCTSASY
jgi:hypothetical protein